MALDSFILYKSQCATILKLSDLETGILFKRIINYQISGEVPQIGTAFEEVIFDLFKNQFEMDSKKYDEKCKIRAESGKLGGRPKKANGFEEKAKKANGFLEKQNNPYNENDNENDNENEIYLSPSHEVLEKEISPLIPKPVKNQINYPQDFENFWTAYQHKGSKKPALAQWLKLNPDQKQKSIEKLPEYFLERPEISFRKDAERYLRDMVWEKYSSTNLNAFSIPQNTKTGNANGRNLPDKKSWVEFQEFCNARGMEWTKEIDIRLAYTEVPFDCWGKMYLTDFLRDFSKRKKEVI